MVRENSLDEIFDVNTEKNIDNNKNKNNDKNDIKYKDGCYGYYTANNKNINDNKNNTTTKSVCLIHEVCICCPSCMKCFCNQKYWDMILPQQISKGAFRGFIFISIIIFMITFFLQTYCSGDNSTCISPWPDSWIYRISDINTGRNEYCEDAKYNEFLRTHQNALSNISYMYFGFVIWFFGYCDYMNLKNGIEIFMNIGGNFLYIPVYGPLISFIWGSSLVFLGYGSFLFHASQTIVGWRLDVVSMYVALMAPTSYYLARFLPWYRYPGLVFMFAILLQIWFYDFAYYHIVGIISSTLTITIFVSVLMGMIFIYHFLFPGPLRVRWKHWTGFLNFFFAIFALALGVTFRRMDDSTNCQENGIDRHGFYQPHSVWHVLTSVALFFLYLLYRSESRIHWKTGNKSIAKCCFLIDYITCHHGSNPEKYYSSAVTPTHSAVNPTLAELEISDSSNHVFNNPTIAEMEMTSITTSKHSNSERSNMHSNHSNSERSNMESII